MTHSKIAFLSEMGFTGKIPGDHPNMRTEFAWMHALDADHYSIYAYETVVNYDHVFLIIPKGKTYLSAEGTRLSQEVNPIAALLLSDFIDVLKQHNKQVHFVQEGPHWWFNDYEVVDQVTYYNQLAKVDLIFAHNYTDTVYYSGLFPGKQVYTIRTLMIDSLIKDIEWQPEDKTIIGGNFARWYGGFESYVVAQDFGLPIHGQTSHATRDWEDRMVELLPRVIWVDWMKQLSKFKYAVHLMPTVAAGTFSLNCSYFGIPCIGNIAVDTQAICQPDLSVEVGDIASARRLVNKLKNDKDFYEHCSNTAKDSYGLHYKLETWKQKMNYILNEA